MYEFNPESNKYLVISCLLLVILLLFFLNEITRRNKWAGFGAFVVLPIFLTSLWLTVLSDTAYMDWFHLAKVYSATAGSIGFWCIRHINGINQTSGKSWRLADFKWALLFPPFILAVNIAEAVFRDLQVGSLYFENLTLVEEGNQTQHLIGGSWNYINGLAGILNIVTITGWVGISIRKRTELDSSQDMLWPDMLWFWIIAYDLWNFAYTYNCIPDHSWYAGIALLIAPTMTAFTVGKGAWLQHRAQTLAIWCMFAQTFPSFIDAGIYAVKSTNQPDILLKLSLTALTANVLVFIYMVHKVIKSKRNPYTEELYIDEKGYKSVKLNSDAI